jgi:hypothetical protein
MNGLYEAALEVQRFMTQRGWRSCIIGGLALQRWGRPRVTQDVDMTLLTGLGNEEDYIRELLAAFEPRRPDVADFALRNRVLLLNASNGTPVDLALAGFPFEEIVVSRATPFEFAPGVSLVTCSAEDLVVLKAFASRAQDWVDVEGILIRQWDGLDWTYIQERLAPLAELKDEPEIVERLTALRDKLEAEMPDDVAGRKET